MPEIKTDENKKLLKNILFGILAAVCTTVICLFLMAIVMTLAGISSKFASPLSGVALALGGIFGGFLSARKNGKKGLLCGILTAVAVFIIITVAGMLINDNFSVMSLIHLAILLLSGGIGGIIGVNKTEKRKIV